MKTMCKNKYQEYLKVNAERIFTDEKYSYANYNKDADNVKVLPFDLSKFNIPSDIENAINVYFVSERIDDDGVLTLIGSSESENEWCVIAEKLKLKTVTGYYYSGYCYNDKHNFYMSYCEGDLFLKLFKDSSEYKKSLAATINWYAENA